MPIIIIASDPNEIAPPAPAPVEAPPSQPAPAAAPLPSKKPPLNVKPQAPAQEQTAPEADEIAPQFHNQLVDIVNKIRSSKDEFEINDWTNALFNFPTLSGNVLSSLVHKLPKPKQMQPIEDQEQDVKVYVSEALKNADLSKITNLYNFLAISVNRMGRHDLTREGDKGFGGMTEDYIVLKPYLRYMANPSNPPPDAKPVDPDLVQMVDNGQITPEKAVYDMYRRFRWNDHPIPGTSKTRIDVAKQKFDQLRDQLYAPSIKEFHQDMERLQQRRATDPSFAKKYDYEKKRVEGKFRNLKLLSDNPIQIGVEPITTPNQFNAVLSGLAGIGVDTKPFKNKKSELFLNGEMFSTLESNIKNMYLKAVGEQGQALDATMEGTEGREESLGTGLSAEDYQIMKGRGVVDPNDKTIYQEPKESLIQNAPYMYMSEFDPEDQTKIEQRLPLVQPFATKTDPAGNAKTVANPNFKPMLNQILQGLYGKYSPPLSPPGQKARFTPEQEQRTKDVLLAIGDLYANTFDDQQSQMQKVKELEDQLKPLLQRPLALKHFEGQLHGRGQYPFALREVVMDIMDYLANDANYQKLVGQAGLPGVAAFKRHLRTASFKALSYFILED